MATQLHQQLKERYAEALDGTLEAVVGRYRIDVRSADRLIEVQQASLSALRDKTRDLLREHCVTIVKPIVRRWHLVKWTKQDGELLSRRLSPKRGDWWQAFDELIYFRNLFPHPNLSIDLVLVDIEEHRVAQKQRRFRGRDYRVLDRVLSEVVETRTLVTRADALRLFPGTLPAEFDTSDIADAWKLPRYVAQRAAYFMREVGIAEICGKRGRSIAYRLLDLAEPTKKKRTRRRKSA